MGMRVRSAESVCEGTGACWLRIGAEMSFTPALVPGGRRIRAEVGYYVVLPE